jgi:hypothetical protein
MASRIRSKRRDSAVTEHQSSFTSNSHRQWAQQKFPAFTELQPDNLNHKHRPQPQASPSTTSIALNHNHNHRRHALNPLDSRHTSSILRRHDRARYHPPRRYHSRRLQTAHRRCSVGTFRIRPGLPTSPQRYACFQSPALYNANDGNRHNAHHTK